MPVTALATGWPNLRLKGRIDTILPEVDETSRTLTVRAELQNPDLKLAPGMYVSLDFESAEGPAQPVVPSEAIIATGQRKVVIVAHPNGSFGVAKVTTGTESGGKTAILSGLDVGQSVVLSGQFLIDSEASLTQTVERLTATTAPSDVTQ